MKRVFGGITMSVLLLVAAGVAAPLKTAWADPHAIFYTAIGQQQLFFNVLAALNQADYVETAQQRRALLEGRAGAPGSFVSEQEAQVRRTDLQGDSGPPGQGQRGTPALLSRNVTLEGADLYTDQLVRLFGAEHARRNSLSELLQTFCDFGLGILSCGFNEPPGTTAAQRAIYRRNAVVVDPLAWSALPLTHGVTAALYSGDTRQIYPDPRAAPGAGGVPTTFLNDPQYRAEKLRNPDQFGSTPFAYSPTIAAWRRAIQGVIDGGGSTGADAQSHLERLDNAAAQIEHTYAGTDSLVTANWPLRHVNAVGELNCVQRGQSTGTLIFGPPSGSTGIDCSPGGPIVPPGINDVNDYIAFAALEANQLLSQLRSIASSAAQRIQTQQALIEEQGVLADIQPQSRWLGFPQCRDGIDNDRDGRIDLADGDCPHRGIQFEGTQPNLAQPLELVALVDSPVAARAGTVYGIPNSLATLDASQRASALQGLNTPGQTELVYRPGGGGQGPGQGSGQGQPPPPPPGPTVQGVAATGSQPADAAAHEPGEVLSSHTGSGGLNLLRLFGSAPLFYDEPKDPRSPSDNLIQPHLEQGAVHSLRALTGNRYRGGSGVVCGFTCP